MENGGSTVPQPSSDSHEEDVITKETGTSSETESCETETEKAETSKPEPCDAEPRKAKQKTAKGRRCRRRRRRRCHRGNFSSFGTYYRRVLKQEHTGLSLSRESVNILDSFVKDMFERIAEEAGRLARRNKRCTIMTEDIQTAVRLLLPGELGKYATSEATKAVITYHLSG